MVVLLMAGTSAVLAVLAGPDARGLASRRRQLRQRLRLGTDNPVRRVMMGEVVGRERMGTAMSLDVGANNASRMVGPAVGGLLLAGRASRARSC